MSIERRGSVGRSVWSRRGLAMTLVSLSCFVACDESQDDAADRGTEDVLDLSLIHI